MIDNDNAIEIHFEPPEADIVWEHYLQTGRGAGVEPVSGEQADKIITEWSEPIDAGLATPKQH